MRKILIVAAACFALSTASWATTCGTLGDLANGGCPDLNGTVFSNLSTTLTSTLQSGITLTPLTSGGFTASLDLTALANSSNTLNFTITAPAGFNLTDLDVSIAGASGVTLTLSNSVFTGGSITASSGGAVHPTFSGVGSLDLTGTLAVAAGATGTATLTISPSLTSTSPVPEPATFALGIIGLLAMGGMVRKFAF